MTKTMGTSPGTLNPNANPDFVNNVTSHHADFYDSHLIRGWFRNHELEVEFIVAERDRCFTRFAAALSILIVACLVYLPTETKSKERDVVIILLIVLAIVFFVACGIWIARKRAVADASATTRQQSQHDENKKKTPNDVVEVDQPTTIDVVQGLVDEQHQTSNRQQNSIINAVAKYDQLHEFLTAAYALIVTVFGVVYFSQAQSNCVYLFHHHDDQENHVDCPFNIYPTIVLMISVNAHVIGQPRAIVIAAQYAISIIIFPLMVTFHNLSPSSVLFIWVFYGFFLLFSAILKFSEERKYRERFVAQHKLECRHAEIVERTASLRAFVLSITPPHLRSRLKNPSQTVSVDFSENALCLVVHNRNVVQFMQEVIPTEGAKRLALFRHLTERVVKSHSFHMVRSFGDAMYFVSNLFREDHATTETAVAAGIRAATEIEVPSRWNNATGESQLQVCCGLAVGTLTGLPVGTTCIRYDVFGPAVSEAYSLAASSVAGQLVHVSSRIVSTMGDQLVLSSEHTVQQSADRHNNAPSHSTTSTQFVNGVLLDTNRTTSPTPIMASNSGSTTTTTTLDNATPKYPNPLSSDNSFEGFDVMNQIGTNNDDQNINGGGGGGTKIIRTQITVAPSPNLELTDSACCWLPKHFVDQDIRKEALKKRMHRSLWSFAVVNVMYSVLLMVVVLIACTDDEGGVGDLSEPRHVAGTILLAVCGAAHLVVAIRPLFVGTVTTQHQFCSFTFQLFSLISIALLRPTVASESGMAFHYVFMIGILSMGMGPRSMIGTIVAIDVLQVLIEAFVFPRFTRGTAFVPFTILLYINAAVVSWSQSLLLHANTVAVEHALQELDVHAQIRDAVMAAVIPRPLVHRILPSKLTERRIDVWGVDQCVSIVLEVGSMDLADHRQQQQRQQDSGEKCNATQVQQSIQGQLGLIEDSVAATPNNILSIVKVFGSNVLIAGPLEETPQMGAATATLACSDAIHIVATLLKAKLPPKSNGALGPYDVAVSNKGPTDLREEDAASRDVLRQESSNSQDEGSNSNKAQSNHDQHGHLQFTAAVAIEQGICVLTTSAFPQYELLGTSVTTARALVAAAAPATSIMCTEQFTKMFERECPTDPRVEFQAAERWRLKDVGSVQIRRLKMK